MKILAIIASPREKGNTYNLTKLVEEQMKSAGDFEFEYILLNEENLGLCTGCANCLNEGDEYCPNKDAIIEIRDKMDKADGVIFATPVFVFNVSWLMKNFIDRLCYVCHRPRFQGKRSMTVITTGGIGAGFVAFLLSFMTGFWGYKTVSKLNVAIGASKRDNSAFADKKNIKAIAKASNKFARSLKDNRPLPPSFFSLMSFQLAKRGFMTPGATKGDKKYWADKGWFDKKAYYYYPVKVNPVKLALASSIVSVLWALTLKKQFTSYS
jgi:multimeric flavodoxin WrbA